MATLSTADRFNILGCEISTADPQTAIEAISERIKSGEGGYVCFSNVHTVVTSRKNITLRDSTNDSFLSMPDGKPLSVYANIKGYKDVEQVAGPDFLPYFLKTVKGARHFFYGSTPETLEKLVTNFSKLYPEAIISGAYSPPVRELTPAEV